MIVMILFDPPHVTSALLGDGVEQVNKYHEIQGGCVNPTCLSK